MPPKRKASSAANKVQTKKKKTVTKTTEKKKIVAKTAEENLVKNTPKQPKQIELNLKSYLKDKKWASLLADEFEKAYFKELEKKIGLEYSKKTVFPEKDLIFNAFNLTPLDEVKVVILGQDPYFNDGQAHGLSFSVPRDQAIPGSLKNIYKELEKDIDGFKVPDHGCLESWAKEGVLLLNATLTVEKGKPNSHAKLGWQTFTDEVIKLMSERCTGIVFLLWGGFAHKKAKLIDEEKHRIVKTAHPSGQSYSHFKDCHCFANVNTELKKLKKSPLEWTI